MTATATTGKPTPYELHLGRGWLTAENSLVRVVNTNDANGYYKALGLRPDATMDQIKAAYRELLKTLHPDRKGDDELFRFIADIAKVLLDPREKNVNYDSVSDDYLYIGTMEREELARTGIFDGERSKAWSSGIRQRRRQHWACLTSTGIEPGEDTDAWTDFCFQVSPAVGYRGKIRVGIIEDGLVLPWGLLAFDGSIFLVFQRGVLPNRLHALCAMIDWQRYLQNQIRGLGPTREREPRGSNNRR